ncbi:trypsin-like serine protease [Allobaculum stercoricanis]|uniref:trypsin-like serine protease n=1 Tax=Allobaculum stercoricanis TaxID=174709 RepID=UPI0029420566|nr:trypsin-like serine protease [Allobaculum stercoricanis]
MKCSVYSLLSSMMMFSSASPLLAKTEQTFEESFTMEGIDIVPFKVIGEDEREKVKDPNQAPYNSLVKIKIKFAKGTYFSSGFLIDESNILTAGHAVYDPDHGAVEKVTVVIGGTNEVYELGPNAIFVSPEYVKDPDNHSEDAGLIHLNTPLTGKRKYFTLANEATINSLVDQKNKVQLAGFTNESGVDIKDLVPWTMKGTILTTTVNGQPNMLLHDVDTASGQSGSPLFIEKDGEYQVVAIHINALARVDANGGLKINDSIHKLIRRANPTKEMTNAVYRAYNPNSGEHFFTPNYTEFKAITLQGWDDEGVAWMTQTEKNGEALYRLYNPNDGLHHYTSDTKERDELVKIGWNDEGIAWYASVNPTHAAVYRLYNPNDGQHHYTMDVEEKTALVALGWNDEGVGYRTAPIPKN